MNYPSDTRQSTNVETQPPMTPQQIAVPALPWLQQAILDYLSNKANRHYQPAPDMLPQPFGGRLDMGRNLPQGRFDWGSGLR